MSHSLWVHYWNHKAVRFCSFRLDFAALGGIPDFSRNHTWKAVVQCPQGPPDGAGRNSCFHVLDAEKTLSSFFAFSGLKKANLAHSQIVVFEEAKCTMPRYSHFTAAGGRKLFYSFWDLWKLHFSKFKRAFPLWLNHFYLGFHAVKCVITDLSFA